MRTLTVYTVILFLGKKAGSHRMASHEARFEEPLGPAALADRLSDLGVVGWAEIGRVTEDDEEAISISA